MPDREISTVRKLASLKGYPEQIPPALSCLLSVQDRPGQVRWNELVDCLARDLPQLAPLGAKLENLISAQVLPTLRKIGVAYGRHQETRLSYEGRYLARIIHDNVKFKTGLASVILAADTRNWHLVEAAKKSRQYAGQATPIYEVALELTDMGIDPCQSFKDLPDDVRGNFKRRGIRTDGRRSRLSQMIQFFNYVDILRRSAGTITLLDSTLQRARRARTRMIREGVKREEFLTVLLETYDTLSDHFRSPYVPIMPLRETVCDRLSVDQPEFERLLGGMIPSFGSYRLLLSSHSGSQPDWKTIRLGNNRFYYLSIYREDEVSQGGD